MRILRQLSNRPLTCGCQAGVYETVDGPVTLILEARGDACDDPRHRPGRSLRDAERGDLPSLHTRAPHHELAR